MKHPLLRRLSFLLAVCGLALLPMVAAAYDLPDEEQITKDPTQLFACFEYNLEQVQDYTATFIKYEVLDGKPYPEETLKVSFMRPHRVKLEWLDGESRGMWAIYDSQRDPDHFWALDVGWRAIIGVQRYGMHSKFTQFFHPNRFVVTDSDLASLVCVIGHFCELAGSLGTLDTHYNGRVIEQGSGRESFWIHAFLYPEPDPRFMAREADVYLTVDDCMPVNVTLYGWEGQVIGRYIQRDLKLNIGLTTADFAIPE
ncbi:MAG: DUF1571 domain-containing protein [Candidatus Alcyoniella australis]|nr:DUF1571 domain-containing protein [Candidatus Alcyoniella australis]